MDERLTSSKAYWDLHAHHDPLWAVLSEEGKANRAWKLQAFMKSGEREVSLLVHHLRSHGIAVSFGRALDFGCGVGRLTQALAQQFQSVLGLDISPKMIEIARAINRFGNVEYQVNDEPTFPRLQSGAFDLIYSSIVLQHIEPHVAKDYLVSLLRVLRSEGVLVFRIPSHRAPTPSNLPRAMPEAAYRAGLSFVQPIPTRLAPGDDLAMAVNIQNLSRDVWSQDLYGSLRLGNHWLSAAEKMLVQDDARASLPETLAPKEQCVVQMTAQVPRDTGKFILEIDVVHEGISWFQDRGSPTLRAAVVVGAIQEPVDDATKTRAASYSDEELLGKLGPSGGTMAPGAFPMYGIAKEEVIDLIRQSGGTVLLAENDDHGRPEWVGYQYIVTKG